MASATQARGTDKTLWTIVLIGAFLFIIWKLLPALKNLLSGGGQSGGATGGTTAQGQYPYQQPGGGSSPGGVGANFGGGPGGQSGENPLQEWLTQVVNSGYYAANQMGSYSDLLGSDEAGLSNLDEAGLPLENVPGYSNPDQYLVTQDVPGSSAGDYGSGSIDGMTGDEGEDAGGSVPYEPTEIYSS